MKQVGARTSAKDVASIGSRLYTNAAATGTVTIDCARYDEFDLTLTGNTTLVLGNPPAIAGESYTIIVRVRQGSTAFTFTQPTVGATFGTVVTPAASKIAEYLYSTANGTTWNLYAGPST